MSVTLPFTPIDGKKAAVYFVDGDGVTRMDVTGSGKDGVTFGTDHNSVYIVSYEDEGSADDGLLLVRAVAAVALMASLGCMLLLLRRRRNARNTS